MRKRKVFFIFSLASLVLIIIFIYISNRDRRKIILEDMMGLDSGSYNITSRADIKKIDTIINSLIPLDIESSDEIYRIGGFLVVIEEYVEDNIIAYRIHGNDATKYVFEGDEENLISKTYYELDDENLQLLADMVYDKKTRKSKKS